MIQPDPPPQFIIIGLKEVLEEVKKIDRNQCDLVNRIDVHIAEQRLRMHALETSNDDHQKALKTHRDALAALKETSVTRTAMWTGIGTLAAVGTLAVASVALFK